MRQRQIENYIDKFGDIVFDITAPVLLFICLIVILFGSALMLMTIASLLLKVFGYGP